MQSAISQESARAAAAAEPRAPTLPALDTRFTLGSTDHRRAAPFPRPPRVPRVLEGGSSGRGRDDRARARSHREASGSPSRRTNVYGIPLFWGKNEGQPFLQRFPFTSTFSRPIHDFVRDQRFAPIRDLVGAGARIGDRRKGRRRREPVRQRAGERAPSARLAHRRSTGPLLPANAEADAQHRAAPRPLSGRQRRPAAHPRQPHAGVPLDVLPQAVLREPRARSRRRSPSRPSPAISPCTTGASGTGSRSRRVRVRPASGARCTSLT